MGENTTDNASDCDRGDRTRLESTSKYPPDKVESILERIALVPENFDKKFYGAGFLDPVAALKNENNNSGNK